MSLPQPVAEVAPVPHGRTAQRLDWLLLPPMVRRMVEDKVGFRVVRADSAGAGFTPGFASVLCGARGERVFVKAASTKAQRPFAEAYRIEIERLRTLPEDLPAARLLWSHEDDLWVVLALEHVVGHNPARPWRRTELDACLDLLEDLADRATPPPGGMDLPALGDELAGFLTGWEHVRRHSPGWPHLEEAAALAGRMREVTAGSTLVHTDARDDNFLLRPDGTALLCDWNWAAVGAAWVDTVLLLISAHGDGVDADSVLAGRRLTRDVDPAHVDVLLALVCGYMLESRDRPVPASSPYLRVHARWYAEASWAWLAQRRGW